MKKSAFKVINNKNYNVENEDLRKYGSAVSFILVAKNVMGARESAKVMKIAEETGTLVRIVSGKKSGNSKSIISLMNLGITPEKSLVLSIHGAKNQEAFHEIAKVIIGEGDK